MKPPTLTFCGGCGGTTGSNYLLETETTKILVDCGLHQGSSFGERHNYEPFLYDPKSIDAVFITHGHVDHTGRLPQLVKAGLTCPIYSTPPTKDVAEFLLLDSQHLLEEEAKKKKHAPLYGVQDVATALSLWRTVEYHKPIVVGDITATLYDAGHILGSASVFVEAGGKRIVFSGDLGNMPEPLINPVEYFTEVDYALVESTYGGRVHEELDRRRDILEDVIEDTAAAGGTLMIPAFALERTQELLFELNQLIEHGRVPKVSVFIDSPLAIKLTGVYQKYARDTTYFNEHAVELMKGSENIFNFPGLRLTLTTEESKQINEVPPPKVIVAGAGMSNGGRILHHERRYLSDSKNGILFIGYQGVGSLGRMILEGAEVVKIFGEPVPVRAKKHQLSGYSAHADQPQLLRWVEPMRLSLTKIFVVQGDVEQANSLAQKIRDDFAVDAVIPSLGDHAVLS